jgi:hypothetical protein
MENGKSKVNGGRDTVVHSPLRLRALLLGVLLIFASHVWIVQLEIVRYSFPTIVSPFYNVIFILFLLTLFNVALSRWKPRAALTQVELLAVYVMLSVASALHSSDMLGVLISMMGYAFYFATPQNRWDELIHPHLPRWLTVQDRDALKGFYNGDSTLYNGAHVQAWLLPSAMWILFTFVLVWTMICLAALLRRQWIERERLSYPIIEIPLALTTGAPFFQNRLMWSGFAITFLTTLLNGFNYLYPGIVPAIPLKRQPLAPCFTSPPWNAIANTQIMFYPFGIALAFLMPLDLSMSCVLFYWVYKLSLVVSASFGADPGAGFPYHRDQAFGAYIGLFLVGLYRSRHAFVRAWHGRRQIRNPKSEIRNGNDDPISDRLALLSILVGFVFLVAFAGAMGMSLWLAVVFFLIYFALAVLASRIRAEIGFPVHDLHFTQPHQAMTRLFGASAFSARDLSVFALFHWFNRVYRSHPMPHIAESFKLSDRTQSVPRAMLTALVVAVLVAVPASFWAYLDMYYRLGAATGKVEIWSLGFGREIYNQLGTWMNSSEQSNPPAIYAAGFGLTLTLILSWARTRFLWFPFHPLAYAIANGWGMHNLWLCVFIGWLLKWLMSKYMGMTQYRRVVPFFVGIIMGEFVMGSVWSIYGVLRGIRTYDFWP